MNRQIIIRRVAQLEIDRAVIWYEEKAIGLGCDLLDEIALVIRKIEERPASFPVDHRVARRARLDRFPYAIYFILTDQVTSIVAFLHGSQSKEEQLEDRI